MFMFKYDIKGITTFLKPNLNEYIIRFKIKFIIVDLFKNINQQIHSK